MTTPSIVPGPELSHEIGRIIAEARGADEADAPKAWDNACRQLESLISMMNVARPSDAAGIRRAG